MRKCPSPLVLGASVLALGACGSSTKTVSVGGAPASSQTAQQTSATTASTSNRKPTTTPSSGGTPTSGSTRSAPEPAFVQQERTVQGLSGAAAVVRARGFTPTDPSDYHANQALRVLIGLRTGSGDGSGQQAFFFVNERYLGTDATAPSARLRVASQSDTEVTLAYPLYRRSDPLCCPSGGQARVRFQLNNGKLSALGPIPPVSSSRGPGRL